MASVDRPWPFHDIREPEAFCGRVIERSGRTLDYHQRERLAQFLLIELWQLALRFEKRGRLSFSTWAGHTLPKRVTDWERSAEEGGRTIWKFGDGRVHERKRPQFVSLDDPDNDRLEASLPGSSLDNDPSGFAEELRDLRSRARRPSRRNNWLGNELKRLGEELEQIEEHPGHPPPLETPPAMAPAQPD